MFYETSEVKNATDTGMLYVIVKYWLTEEAHDRDPDNPYFTNEMRFSQKYFTSRETVRDVVNAKAEARWVRAVRDRERGDGTARATITQEHIRQGVVVRRVDQVAKQPTRTDNDEEANDLLTEADVIAMRGAKHNRPGAVRPDA